ncbi:hypothetical protein EYF80_016303 [Liparis tanakae]|uniref:Uncharacterized protein n=1 Tax=Liparis tanakae TaxID=230148 RepID=A0A4Z2I8S6_9TELE|nr:hypothetical protein EYF80_016303 [Liparis tanakae]
MGGYNKRVCWDLPRATGEVKGQRKRRTNDVIDDIIHLKRDDGEELLEFRVSKAMGLLGALLPGPGGMPP